MCKTFHANYHRLFSSDNRQQQEQSQFHSVALKPNFIVVAPVVPAEQRDLNSSDVRYEIVLFYGRTQPEHRIPI